MKKISAILVFLLILSVCGFVYAEDILIAPAPPSDDIIMMSSPRVVDDADLLTDDEEALLTDKLDNLSIKHEMDVVVVTTYSTGSLSPMEYADDYFDYNGYGFGPERDGLLLLVSMEYSDWWISTCGYGITAFTDFGISYIGEQIVPYMSNGDFYGAFDSFATYCDEFITLADNGEPFDVHSIPKAPFDVVKTLGISLVAGIAIAFVIMLVLKGQLKSVRYKAASSDYIVPGSMNLTYSNDIFITSHISRKAKPKEESSGGSSTHTSSSGNTHGGGGGKF